MNKRGFSLIELLVVIFIISITSALVIPSLWRTEEDALVKEAKHISSTLRYVYDVTVSRREKHLFFMNLDTDSYGFEGESESRNFRMKEEGSFRDVLVPSMGKRSEGEVTVEFGPLGPDEPIIIHLVIGDYEYTVVFNHITGRTKIIKGYST
jgi:prepilin-type N-terminal cleavage/methylation domain-containing protein